MTNSQQYLNDHLQQVKNSCDIWLNKQKQLLQARKYQAMQMYIENARVRMEDFNQKMIQQFRITMEDIEKRRQNEPILKSLYNRMEESERSRLENSLKKSMEIFQNEVLYHKKNLQ